MLMKKILLPLLIATAIGFAVGCGKSDPGAAAPDPNTQPEAQAMLFQRTTDRVKGLIAAKDFATAREALDTLTKYNKLTPEQQKVVDKLKEQIPAN